MPDIVNYTLRDVDYLCVSINTPELCSGTRLSYLETVWFFLVLLLLTVRQNQCGVYSRANYSPSTKDAFEYCTQRPVNESSGSQSA